MDGNTGKTIEIHENDLYKKIYKIRKTANKSLETTIPYEAFEREARRRGMTVEEAISELNAVWGYDSFPGLHLSFELKEDVS